MNVFTVVKRLYNAPLDDRPVVKLSEAASEDSELPGVTNKLSFKGEGQLVVKGGCEVDYGEVLVREEAFAAVLGDGPEQGQMCPQTFEHMPGPLPCSFGSDEVFGSVAGRDRADASYQRFEWRIRDGG